MHQILRILQFLTSVIVFFLSLLIFTSFLARFCRDPTALIRKSSSIQTLEISNCIIFLIATKKAFFEILIVLFPVPFYLVMVLVSSEERAEQVLQDSIIDILGTAPGYSPSLIQSRLRISLEPLTFEEVFNMLPISFDLQRHS